MENPKEKEKRRVKEQVGKDMLMATRKEEEKEEATEDGEPKAVANPISTTNAKVRETMGECLSMLWKALSLPAYLQTKAPWHERWSYKKCSSKRSVNSSG